MFVKKKKKKEYPLHWRGYNVYSLGAGPRPEFSLSTCSTAAVYEDVSSSQTAVAQRDEKHALSAVSDVLHVWNPGFSQITAS